MCKRKQWITTWFVSCAVLTTLLIIVGVHENIIKEKEPNQCEMTWMYEWPEYLKVPLDSNIKRQFPKYSLYLYTEGGLYAEQSRDFNLNGIPVLFIPGNAGSYGQVRSLASVALSKSQNLKYHFNYFTIDFAEEFSVAFGGYLERQIKFVHECNKIILGLYNAPIGTERKQIIFIGHSMGGIIILGLLTLPGFSVSIMNNVILLATPVVEPVVPFDPLIQKLYLNIHLFLRNQLSSSSMSILKNVTFLSIGGGIRDKQVRSDLISLENLISKELSLSVLTSAIPKVQLSTDHLCIVWCNQLVLTINRALFDMVDKKTHQVIADTELRMNILNYHFKSHAGLSNSFWSFQNLDKVGSVSSKSCAQIKKRAFWYCPDSEWSCLTSHSTDRNGTISFLSHHGPEKWLFLCTQVKGDKCAISQDLSEQGKLVDYKGSFRMARIKAQNKTMYIVTKSLTAKCLAIFTESTYSHIDESLVSLFESTEFQINNTNFFTAIDLPFVRYPWDVYNIKVTQLKCAETKQHTKLLGQLHIPWFSEDVTMKGNKDYITDSLQLFKEKPSGLKDTAVQVLLWHGDGCDIQLILQRNLIISFAELLKYNFMDGFRWITAFFTIFLMESVDSHITLSSVMEQNWLFYSLYLSALSIVDRTMIQQHTLHRSLTCLLFHIVQSVGSVFVCTLGLNSLVYINRKVFRFWLRLFSLLASHITPKYFLMNSTSIKFSLVQLIISLILSISFCGSLGLLITFLIYYTKFVFVVGSNQLSILFLLLLLFCYSSMSILAWIEELSITYKLYSDCSSIYAIVTCVMLFIIENFSCQIPRPLTHSSKKIFKILKKSSALVLSSVLLYHNFYICWTPYVLTVALSLYALLHHVHSNVLEKLDKVS